MCREPVLPCSSSSAGFVLQGKRLLSIDITVVFSGQGELTLPRFACGNSKKMMDSISSPSRECHSCGKMYSHRGLLITVDEAKASS